MPARHWRRKHRNRGAIFVDGDNHQRLFQPEPEHAYYGTRKTLTSLFDWIEQPDNLGITQITARYVHITCRNVLRPLPEETGLERRPHSVKLRAYPYPVEAGTPGYEDEVIWDDIVAAAERNEADTFVIVTSDWKGFQWADRIHFATEGTFADKEAVVIYSHLNTRVDLARDPRNAVSLEAIYPDLNRQFVDLHGYNPLNLDWSMPA